MTRPSTSDHAFSRRTFLAASACLSGGALLSPHWLAAELVPSETLAGLQQFGYGDVSFLPGLPDQQLHQTIDVLMGLSDDELLKPFRVRAGVAAPGKNLGGWYDVNGYAPGHTFGQWVSALSRYYAITGEQAAHAKVRRLIQGLAAVPDPQGQFFENTRFPAYTLEKLNCGMIDAFSFAHDPGALDLLATLTARAIPHLPEKALSRAEQQARPHKDISYTYDEAYTLPENYFLAYQRTGTKLYRELGVRFLLDDEFLTPLANGQNVLPGLHAFSHLNALNSSVQAYVVLDDPKYLRAARNGFRFIQEQSYATGGWGPEERFVTPGRGELANSLTATHTSFETPCGSYGHFKLTRTLLAATRDSTYGDSMETVFYNTVQGSKPLQPDGSAFYYSDYNPDGHKVYARDKWPCCSGTLPQVTADYRISTYLHDDRTLFVNLYVPSAVTWRSQGGEVKVRQQSAYPLEGRIRLTIESAKNRDFALGLRIPEWAGGDATLSINGAPYRGAVQGGTFATIRRPWHKGDQVDLFLPLNLRLVPVDSETPGTVALMRGPLVLFPLGQGARTVRQSDLLQARQTSPGEWLVPSAREDIRLRPFPSIHDEPYSTYIDLA